MRWKIYPYTLVFFMNSKIFQVILLDLNWFACCWFLSVAAPTCPNLIEAHTIQMLCKRGLIGCLVIQFLSFFSQYLIKQTASKLIVENEMELGDCEGSLLLNEWLIEVASSAEKDETRALVVSGIKDYCSDAWKYFKCHCSKHHQPYLKCLSRFLFSRV